MKRGKLLHILELESTGKLCQVDFSADGLSEVSSPLMSSDNCQDFIKTLMLTQESLNKISSQKTALETNVSDSLNYSCPLQNFLETDISAFPILHCYGTSNPGRLTISSFETWSLKLCSTLFTKRYCSLDWHIVIILKDFLFGVKH